MFQGSRTRTRRRGEESSVKRHIIVGVALCSSIALLCYGVWYITRLPVFTIGNVTIEGGETIEHDTILAQVDEALQGTYFKLIPHRFFLMYPHDEIVSTVGREERIRDVYVTRTSKNDLLVEFSEYEPFALQCMNVPDNPGCFFLDQNGYAFAQSPQLEGGALVRHIVEGEEPLSEKQAFETDNFRRVHTLLSALVADLNIRVTEVRYTQAGDIALHINGGGMIYMRDSESYEDALNNIKTVLGSESFDHLEPGNFQYIDVRFGNKVFVNEEPELIDVATTTEPTATTT